MKNKHIGWDARIIYHLKYYKNTNTSYVQMAKIIIVFLSHPFIELTLDTLFLTSTTTLQNMYYYHYFADQKKSGFCNIE